ncbi:hypothetical protein [Clavibacter michiganensis]|uniref:hypothetical protein n=1 Tax=Clavibacter michiganensis TaxID=28447 RepID=UPI0005BD6A65|nr:hypothetical protein [Clavibacter michiganensis]
MRAQTVTLDTVLHRRRWRSERGVLLALLRRGGHRWTLLAQLVGADLPGRGTAASIRISMAAALAVGLLASASLAVAAGALPLRLTRDVAVPAAAAAVLLLAALTGAASWRRVAVLPFDDLRRLSPIPDARLARRLARAALVYSLMCSAPAWAAPPLAALAMSVPPGDAASALVAAPPLLLGAAALFALGHGAGARVAVAVVRSRATGRVGVRRLLVHLACCAIGATLGWSVARNLLVTAVTTLQDAFPDLGRLADADAWEGIEPLAAEYLARAWAGPASALAAVDPRACALAAAATLLVGAATAHLIPPALIDRLPGHSGPGDLARPDAFDVWVDRLRRTRAPWRTAGADPLREVLLRRLRASRWAVAPAFWARILPTVESCVQLGVAAGLALGVAGTGLSTLVLVVGVLFAVHGDATEMRAELAPATAVQADGPAVSLLRQAPGGRGILHATRARVDLLGVLLVPSTAVVLVVVLAVAWADGLSPWSLAMLVAAAAVSPLVAASAQWYMGPRLYLDAMEQRAEEAGLESSAQDIQRAMQAAPRYPLVVVPALLTTGAFLLQAHVPDGLLLALAAAVVVVQPVGLVLLGRASRALLGAEHRGATT